MNDTFSTFSYKWGILKRERIFYLCWRENNGFTFIHYTISIGFVYGRKVTKISRRGCTKAMAAAFSKELHCEENIEGESVLFFEYIGSSIEEIFGYHSGIHRIDGIRYLIESINLFRMRFG